MGQVVAFSFFFTLLIGLLATLLISSAFKLNELPTKEDFKRLEEKLDQHAEKLNQQFDRISEAMLRHERELGRLEASKSNK